MSVFFKKYNPLCFPFQPKQQVQLLQVLLSVNQYRFRAGVAGGDGRSYQVLRETERQQEELKEVIGSQAELLHSLPNRPSSPQCVSEADAAEEGDFLDKHFEDGVQYFKDFEPGFLVSQLPSIFDSVQQRGLTSNLKFLGSGQYGSVFSVEVPWAKREPQRFNNGSRDQPDTDEKMTRKFQIKLIKVQDSDPMPMTIDKQFHVTLNEAQIQQNQQKNSGYAPKVLGYLRYFSHFIIFMDIAPGISLWDLMHRTEWKDQTQKQIYKLVQSLDKGLSSMHQYQVYHGDLNAKNVIVDLEQFLLQKDGNENPSDQGEDKQKMISFIDFGIQQEFAFQRKTAQQVSSASAEEKFNWLQYYFDKVFIHKPAGYWQQEQICSQNFQNDQIENLLNLWDGLHRYQETLPDCQNNKATLIDVLKSLCIQNTERPEFINQFNQIFQYLSGFLSQESDYIQLNHYILYNPHRISLVKYHRTFAELNKGDFETLEKPDQGYGGELENCTEGSDNFYLSAESDQEGDNNSNSISESEAHIDDIQYCGEQDNSSDYFINPDQLEFEKIDLKQEKTNDQDQVQEEKIKPVSASQQDYV